MKKGKIGAVVIVLIILAVGYFVLQGDAPSDDAENLILEPYILEVDVRADSSGFYVLYVTHVDNGQQYKMPVTSSALGREPYDGYVLEAGDIVQVEVDSIEGGKSGLPTIHPAAITVLRKAVSAPSDGAENLIFEPYILAVDVRFDASGFYVVHVTRADNGQQYQMQVFKSTVIHEPYDEYDLGAGDIVQVEVDSIEEREAGLPILHPAAITVLQAVNAPFDNADNFILEPHIFETE